MLTSSQIVEILGERGTGMQRGGLLFHRQRMHDYGRRYSDAQRDLVEKLLEQAGASPEVYTHPESRVRLEPSTTGGTIQKPLEAADLEFLRRLPEPGKVTFDDAVELARFALQVPPGTPDARLVASIWRPVKARHDRLKADAELRDAQRPRLPIPGGAVTALADAYRAETAELSDEECNERASRAVNQVAAERQAAHQQRIDTARQTLTALDDERRQREALVAADA